MADPPSILTDFAQDEIPVVGACSDPVLTVAGHPWTIPFMDKMSGFRDILGWAFYIWTGLALIHIALSLPGKERS